VTLLDDLINISLLCAVLFGGVAITVAALLCFFELFVDD